jgi:hypothetical protein
MRGVQDQRIEGIVQGLVLLAQGSGDFDGSSGHLDLLLYIGSVYELPKGDDVI